MHLRLPSDVPSRALRRRAHRASANGEGLVAPDPRPCLLGVGFPSSGPRVWTFTSSLWVMPLAPVPRPGPLRVPRGRRAGLSRPRHTSLRPRSTYVARDTTPFACVAPPTQTARRAVPGGEAPPPAASRARALTSAAPFAPVPHTPPHPRLRPRHSDHPVARPADMDPGEVVIGRMTVGFIDPTLARLDLRSNEYFATTGTESAAGSSASSLGPPRRPDPRPRPPA